MIFSLHKANDYDHFTMLPCVQTITSLTEKQLARTAVTSLGMPCALNISCLRSHQSVTSSPRSEVYRPIKSNALQLIITSKCILVPMLLSMLDMGGENIDPLGTLSGLVYYTHNTTSQSRVRKGLKNLRGTHSICFSLRSPFQIKLKIKSSGRVNDFKCPRSKAKLNYS